MLNLLFSIGNELFRRRIIRTPPYYIEWVLNDLIIIMGDVEKVKYIFSTFKL